MNVDFKPHKSSGVARLKAFNSLFLLHLLWAFRVEMWMEILNSSTTPSSTSSSSRSSLKLLICRQVCCWRSFLSCPVHWMGSFLHSPILGSGIIHTLREFLVMKQCASISEPSLYAFNKLQTKKRKTVDRRASKNRKIRCSPSSFPLQTSVSIVLLLQLLAVTAARRCAGITSMRRLSTSWPRGPWSFLPRPPNCLRICSASGRSSRPPHKLASLRSSHRAVCLGFPRQIDVSTVSSYFLAALRCAVPQTRRCRGHRRVASKPGHAVAVRSGEVQPFSPS